MSLTGRKTHTKTIDSCDESQPTEKKTENYMTTLKLYYAVNKSGQGCVFEERPRRDTIFEIWVGQYSGSMVMVVARMEALGFVLPKTAWEDEPVELKLTLDYDKE